MLAVCAKYLAQRDLARALAGPRGREVGEIHDRHAENQQRDDRKGRHRALVVARRHDAVLSLAEMDVPYVDEVPVLIVALVGADAFVCFVGNVSLLPSGQCRLELLDVGAGAQGRVDPARLPAPRRQEIG